MALVLLITRDTVGLGAATMRSWLMCTFIFMMPAWICTSPRVLAGDNTVPLVCRCTISTLSPARTLLGGVKLLCEGSAKPSRSSSIPASIRFLSFCISCSGVFAFFFIALSSERMLSASRLAFSSTRFASSLALSKFFCLFFSISWRSFSASFLSLVVSIRVWMASCRSLSAIWR